MAELLGPLLLTASYLLLLAFIAVATERSPRLARIGRHPVAFALALGVYATSWTFYGAVGYAGREGYGFLAINLGVALACLAIPILWSPLAALVRRHRLASTADLFAFRFQSQRVGAAVTTFMVLGLLPYLALQLRAIGDAAAHLAAETPPPWLGTLYALLLSVFAVVVGARYADPWARRPGLLTTLALESLVKLVALFVVTVFAVAETFGGWSGFVAYADRTPQALAHLFAPVREGPWAAMLVLAFAGAFLLPRQFHIAFVEHPSPHALRRAMWVFPLFLLLLNLPVPLLHLVSHAHAAGDAPSDLFVLSASSSPVARLAAFIGGVSAASAMLLVSSIALSGMVVHHVIIPLGRAHVLPDARVRLLRRVVIAALILSALAFHLLIPRTGLLVDLGLVSFAAVAQLLPGTLATLFWPRATRRGVALGLLGGITVWAVFLALPLIAPGHAPERFLVDLGVGGDPRGVTVFLSLGVNVFLFVAGSLSAPPRPAERAAARACTGSDPAAVSPVPASIAELEDRLAAGLGPDDARALVDRALADLELTRGEKRPLELRDLAARVRRSLTERVGPLAARLLVGAPSPEDAREEAATLAAELRPRDGRDALAPSPRDDAGPTLALVRRFLSRVVDDLPVALCAASASGEVLLWNRRLAELTGLHSPATIGTRLEQLPDPWSAVLADPPADAEQTIDVGGRHLVLKVSRSTLAAAGAGAGAQVVLVEDLTAQHLWHAQAAHQDRLASIGRLAAGVAHEVLNPLTGILMVTASLQEEPDATDVPDRLGLIVHEAHRIEAIVRSLLQYSRSGVLGSEPVARLRQPIRPLAEEAVRLVRLGRRARQLSWRVDVPSPLVAAVDGARLVQVLVNLLSNARDASPDGGLVTVTGEALAPATLVLEVHDQGPGIPEPLHARIFEPFFTTNAPGEGTGLGLSLAHRIVHAHGGEIAYLRPPAVPTTFRVTLHEPPDPSAAPPLVPQTLAGP